MCGKQGWNYLDAKHCTICWLGEKFGSMELAQSRYTLSA
jgi:hypothetical protein